MKKTIITLSMISWVCLSLLLNSCAPTKAIQEKSGAQLWGENCNRCHNAPSMDQYSKEHWEIIGTHMKTKAMLTDEETNKIVAFLKGEM